MRTRRFLTGALVACALAPWTGRGLHAQAVRLRVGTIAPAGSPWIQSLELMKKNVESGGSGGGIQFQIFPGGQLGDEVQLAEGTQFGSIECSGISAGALATLVPSFDVFELPYVWKNTEEAYYVIDNHFRSHFAQELQKHGLVLLGWSENGWRNFHTRNRAIRRPEDLRGLRMRSQESPIHLAFWRALGANAQPMAVTDVYQAFERGVIDGGENTIVLTSATGWAEVIKHVTISRHIYQPAVLVCNKKAWDRMSAAQHKRIADAMTLTEKDMRQRLSESETEMLELFKKDLKIQVVELNAGQIDEFRKRTQGVMNQPDIRRHLGAEVLQVLERGKQEFAKQPISVKKF